MNIALDYDDTFSADPVLWRSFVRMAQDQGHTVKIVTARGKDGNTYGRGKQYIEIPEGWNDDLRDGIDGLDLEVIYCAWQPKIRVCDAVGYNVHIWIDDSPDAINLGY